MGDDDGPLNTQTFFVIFHIYPNFQRKIPVRGNLFKLFKYHKKKRKQVKKLRSFKFAQ